MFMLFTYPECFCCCYRQPYNSKFKTPNRNCWLSTRT